jgi:hypothetical protein
MSIKSIFTPDTLMVCCVCLMVGNLGYTIGHEQGKKHDAVECGCGEERSCAFGPAIVGLQRCGSRAKWAACEPDPKYRVEGGAR